MNINYAQIANNQSAPSRHRHRPKGSLKFTLNCRLAMGKSGLVFERLLAKKESGGPGGGLLTSWGSRCTPPGEWGPFASWWSGSTGAQWPTGCTRWSQWWSPSSGSCTGWPVRQGPLPPKGSRGTCPRGKPRRVHLGRK